MEKSKAPKKDDATELFRLCNEYCRAMDRTDNLPLHEFLDNISVSLMAVYQKTFSIARFQTKYENEPKHSLTEKQYNKVRIALKEFIGNKDEYQEIIDPNRPSARVIFKASIAEDLTDIFQDFYDFCQWYGEGTFESNNDSIIELLNNFDKYWGIKLLNVLKAIHIIRYLKKDASLFADSLGDEENDATLPDDEEPDADTVNEILNEDI